MIRLYVATARKYNLGVRRGAWLAIQDTGIRLRSWWTYYGPFASREEQEQQ